MTYWFRPGRALSGWALLAALTEPPLRSRQPDWRLGHPVTIPSRDRTDGYIFCLATIEGMPSSERLDRGKLQQEKLRRSFALLRHQVHQSMKTEEQTRLKEDPQPTEEELYMGAFKEWLEPQVRDAVRLMYKKGYATQSSGFHGEQPELQMIDGYFTFDQATKSALEQMGVKVLRGSAIGVPNNRLITLLQFSASEPSLSALKNRWNAIAAALPYKSYPSGIRPVCDRAEEFRREYAPAHPSLEQAREIYFDYLTRKMSE
jgi:hypothetical protein